MWTRRLPIWGAILGGGVIAVLVFVALTAAGVVVGWVMLSGMTQADQALAAFLWLSVAAILSWAAGGWAAARTVHPPVRSGSLPGLFAGLLALLLLLGLGSVVLDGAVDLSSVAIALGIDEPHNGRVNIPVALPTPAAGAIQATEPEEIARRRTIDAIGYAATVGLLVLLAATLGGLAGHPRREAAPAPTSIRRI